ncbi:HSP90 family protein [Corynebacterium sp. ZY180755]
MAQDRNFQVDLAGMVELLSRNLYSGPRIFVRELLQNAVDAITARREDDPSAPGRVDITIDGANLKFKDTGRGLTLAQTSELLATIGASSKRDEFGFHREDYLGQFGIGLLSAFMVSDTITVYSRSVDALDQPVRWIGHSNGTWSTEAISEEEVPAELSGPGSLVELHAQDFDFARVPELVHYFGRFLDVDITINGQPQNYGAAPWEMTDEGQREWCKVNFGFEPFDVVELHDLIGGVRGVAFIQPRGAHPGQSVRHMVFLRRMLLGDRITEILPEWAYFARVVIDVENLKPTASREQLADDELLAEVRERLGEQLRDWLVRLSELSPHEFAQFVDLHRVGLKSLALIDEPTRRLVARTVPVPTTVGEKTFDEVLAEYGSIRFARTVTAYESIAAVAAARNLCVVNAGYAFDAELIELLKLDYPDAIIAEMDAGTLLDSLEEPTATQRMQLMDAVSACEEAIRGQMVQVTLRSFKPSDMPSLFLHESAAAAQRISEEAAGIDDPLASLVGMVNASAQRKPIRHQLILNADSPMIHQLAAAEPSPVLTAAFRGLYVQALLAARHDLDQQARGWSTSLFSTLINNSL